MVQVYLHDRTGVVLRPRRELAGFAKVRLAPGEQATIDVEVPVRAFAFYDVEQQDWRIPSGPYTLEAARSSVEVVHTADVEVTGGVISAPEPPSTSAVADSDEAFERRLGGPIPTPRPVRPFTRDSTLGEVAQTRLGGLLRTAVLRKAVSEFGGDEDAQHMIERASNELPLRAMAVFSQGRIRLPVLDALVDLLNGHVGAVAGRVGRELGALVRSLTDDR